MTGCVILSACEDLFSALMTKLQTTTQERLQVQARRNTLIFPERHFAVTFGHLDESCRVNGKKKT